jgi:hypothetical protein
MEKPDPKPKLELRDIMPALPALSKRELTLLRAAADHLLGKPTATVGPLYSVLLTVTGSQLPFDKFQRSQAYKSWLENEKLFNAFVTDAWGESLKKVTETALMTYLVGLLADDLKRRGVPVSVGTLAVNLGSAQQVFDTNFPGYRDAGLAHVILDQMVRR